MKLLKTGVKGNGRSPINPEAIQRVTYTLAGQTMAIHVTGDPTPNNNGFFFVISDHLGSTSLLRVRTLTTLDIWYNSFQTNMRKWGPNDHNPSM